MSDLPYKAAISLSITMRGGHKIDLSVKNPVSVNELVASFKRAGIEELVFTQSRVVQDGSGGTETLDFDTVIQDSSLVRGT